MVTNPWVNRITALVVLLAIYAAGYAGGRDAATMAFPLKINLHLQVSIHAMPACHGFGEWPEAMIGVANGSHSRQFSLKKSKHCIKLLPAKMMALPGF
jgi:hypothetical protein